MLLPTLKQLSDRIQGEVAGSLTLGSYRCMPEIAAASREVSVCACVSCGVTGV